MTSTSNMQAQARLYAHMYQATCRMRVPGSGSSKTARFLLSNPRNPVRFGTRAASSTSRRRPAKPSIPGLRQASTSSSSSSSSTPGSHRRAITVTSDDGRYNWSELSTGEKAARGTQQTFNFLLVSVGAVATITVFYLLYTELFAPDSVTIQFNHAVSRIKSSPEARALLGPSSKIKAYGEPTTSKWARARPLAHSSDVDKFGTQHFRMHFNVEGPDGVTGVVNVHMTKPRGADALDYELLSLNVKGHPTLYLENKDAERGVKGKVGKMFGVQWR